MPSVHICSFISLSLLLLLGEVGWVTQVCASVFLIYFETLANWYTGCIRCNSYMRPVAWLFHWRALRRTQKNLALIGLPFIRVIKLDLARRLRSSIVSLFVDGGFPLMSAAPGVVNIKEIILTFHHCKGDQPGFKTGKL